MQDHDPMTSFGAQTGQQCFARRTQDLIIAITLLSGCTGSNVQSSTAMEVPSPPMTAGAALACSGPLPLTLEGFEPGDAMIFVDAPDMDIIRATAPLEIGLTASLSREEIQPPLSKTYCQIGATRMVVEMTQTVEDDAIFALTQRAIYRWVADVSGTGWQIAEIGTRQHCARARNEETNLCL